MKPILPNLSQLKTKDYDVTASIGRFKHEERKKQVFRGVTVLKLHLESNGVAESCPLLFLETKWRLSRFLITSRHPYACAQS